MAPPGGFREAETRAEAEVTHRIRPECRFKAPGSLKAAFQGSGHGIPMLRRLHAPPGASWRIS